MNIRLTLKQPSGISELRSLTTNQLSSLVTELSREGRLAPKTINNCLGLLKKILGDAVVWGYINSNPAKVIQPLKIQQQEPTTFYREEIARLLAFSVERYPAEYELIVFALNTGCRLGECCALDWGKVDLDQRTAIICATYDEKQKVVAQRTKGRRFRKVPLNAECVKLLRGMLLDGRKLESELVFGKVSYYAIAHAKFKRILRRAGLDLAIKRKATFHSLRHTFASEFMRANGSIYRLQLILGHSTVKQTEMYSHFAPDFLVGETDRVSFSKPEGVLRSLSAGS